MNAFACSTGRRLARLAVAGVVAVGPLAWGEVIKLKDGSALEGTLKRTSDGYDVTDASGHVTHVDADNVKGIELSTTRVAAGLEAESRLASLRRSVENVTDLKGIVERYERFIDQNKQSPVGKEAERDAAVWRERLEKGMVKAGNQWVTPEEKTRIVGQGLARAEDARQLLKQGRTKDADPILAEVLSNDPSNAAAAYLRGIVQYKQEQVPAARKLFETVAATVKDHAPTLNNLAVVLWRQNQQAAALNFYLQAMLASPMDVDVLNNVAEALNALPQNQRGNAGAQKAARVFGDQDTALQQQMAQQGWYRWGSTWVDKETIQRLQAIEKEIQRKLDAMSADYDDVKKKISRIDGDIDDNLRRMKTLEATSYATDSKGTVYRLPLPARYYDLKDDNKRLAADRAELVKQADEMRAAAKQVQQQIPTPKFTSTQRLIGVERAPLLPVMKAVPSAQTPASELAPPQMAPLGPETRPSTTKPGEELRRGIPESLLGG